VKLLTFKNLVLPGVLFMSLQKALNMVVNTYQM